MTWGHQYVVEMQNKKIPGFIKRSQFYAAHTYVSQSLKGVRHLHLKPIILLAIANHELFPEKKAVISYHKTLDVDTQEHNLKDLSYAFVELPKFKKEEGDLKTLQDKWIYFFKNWNKTLDVPQGVAEPEIVEAYRSMEEFNWTALEKEAYIKANIALTDEYAAKKEEYDKGKAEGRAEGERKKAIQIIRSMLKKNLSVEEISELTGLSEQEIKVELEKPAAGVSCE